MTRQKQTFSHTGDVVGTDNVTLNTNTEGSQSQILEITAPDKFADVVLDGDQHDTRFIPRTEISISGTTGDDTVVDLVDSNGNEIDIVPVGGEKDINEQDYPVCVAFNATTGTEYDIVDVDYSKNQVTLGTDPASGDTVKLWPILAQGQIKVVGRNALGQAEGPVTPFGLPLYRFHDLPQLKQSTSLSFDGRVEFGNPESIEYVVDSPHQIVWSDADYPRGEFVSSLSQEVTVEV